MIRNMKSRTSILAALMIICGAFGGHASDCHGDGCQIGQLAYPSVGEPTPLGVVEYVTPTPVQRAPAAQAYAIPTQTAPMMPRPIALVPLSGNNGLGTPWDGTFGTFQPRKFDKTVDWRDGIPLWDDSIANYRDKDFSDWYSPMDIYYYSDKQDFVTREAVENLLSPKRPTSNLWADSTVADRGVQKNTDCTPVATPTCPPPALVDPCPSAPKPEPAPVPDVAPVIQPIPVMIDDGCPFETTAECAIWRRKPMVRENVSPRSPRVIPVKMDEFIAAATCDLNISANESVSAPLLDRYKTLMRASNACCTEGMTHALRGAGASDGLIYKFLADDANFYNIGARCLMTTDAEFDTKYPNTATAAVAADVRNGCLCRNRQWFTSMLAPFQAVYDAVPEFATSKFYYTYTDGLQREITVSVNNDVQNVLNQLALCP